MGMQLRQAVIGLVAFTAMQGNAVPQEPARDLKCAALVKTSEGKFGHAELPNYSVINAVRLPGPFDLSAKGMTGIACIRTSLVPIVEDVEVLQAGYNLHIGSSGRMIKLMLDNGRIRYTVNDGSPSDEESRAIQEVMTNMQRVLDVGKAPKP